MVMEAPARPLRSAQNILLVVPASADAVGGSGLRGIASPVSAHSTALEIRGEVWTTALSLALNDPDASVAQNAVRQAR